MLGGKRDKKAVRRFLQKAIGQYGLPEKVVIDKSGSNAVELDTIRFAGMFVSYTLTTK